ELLSTVDILITDYSSIFFDFAVTNKPILFFMKDYDDYEKERGFYFNKNVLPGPICENINALITSIDRIEEYNNVYGKKYENLKKKFNYNDDGKATERLIKTIFEGENNHLKIKTKNEKKKILMYGGGFYNNGITISAINLSKYIDHD